MPIEVHAHFKNIICNKLKKRLKGMDLRSNINAKDENEQRNTFTTCNSYLKPGFIKEKSSVEGEWQIFIKEEKPESNENLNDSIEHFEPISDDSCSDQEVSFDSLLIPEVDLKEEPYTEQECYLPFDFQSEQKFKSEVASQIEQICIRDINHRENLTLKLQDILGSLPGSSTSFENGQYIHNVDDLSSNLELKGKAYECPLCSYKTNRKNNLDRHILIHSAIKMFKCSECSFETVHQSSLNIHILSHTDIKLFQCPHCNYKTNHRSNLKTHILCHSDTKRFQCIACSYQTNHKPHLKTHLLNHSNIKLFKCSECSYETNDRRNLRTHLLKHSDIKLFKCPQCSYSTNVNTHLKRHIQRHSDHKLYKCPNLDCIYETNEKCNLKTHLLNHSNMKLFKCTQCSYGTNRRSDLSSHQVTHSVIKLYKCPECQYESNHKSQLKRHSLNHAGIKLFKCSECHYETNDRSNLKTHKSKHSEERGKDVEELIREVYPSVVLETKDNVGAEENEDKNLALDKDL